MSPNLQETAELVTFPEKVLKGKLLFLCIVKPTLSFLYYPDTIIHSDKKDPKCCPIWAP